MPNFLMINGSPRKNGTANMFCQRLQHNLGGEIVSLYNKVLPLPTLLEKIISADTIILVGPCYVNTYPGTVTELFEYLSNYTSQLKGKSWYGIIEGGMPYTHTHESGLKHLKCFCESCGMHYKGGFLLTMAPLLNGSPLENHKFSKKVVPAFDQFVTAIKMDTISPDQLYYDLAPKMPLWITRLLALFLSHMMDSQFKKSGFNPKEPSPYLSKRTN